ncbi:unnamed protein product [Brachionus calyciflorus]|uniref:Uncharacterized protein n=1 Tax=Brachionus calyciflorus TaxID=104777 RepID=A0A813M728_9BILA|nr:unnamed protein product [Brachionus calyciflorus]
MPVEADNDFDLCDILTQMNTKKPQYLPRRVKPRLNSQKTLTACILDSHYTNGVTEWCFYEPKIELYRGRITQIGSSKKDLECGECIFFDFEPLSTRLKLMCKLIIIIQGAVFERSGPPKLVQDRSIQCPEQSENNSLKLKSSSCENLLEEVKLPYLSDVNKAVFNARVKRTNSKLAEKRLRNRSINNNCLSDDESNGINLEEVKFRDYDPEHYFKFRLTGFNKDYTSLPYYQYSSSIKHQETKFTEMFDERHKNQSTSTDDLINERDISYFTKSELMSSHSLYEKKISTNDLNADTNCQFIPIDIQPKLSQIESENESYEFNENIHQQTKRPGCFIEENLTESYRVEKTGPKILDNFDDSLFERFRIGPKKSSEWSIFRSTPINNLSNYDLKEKNFKTKKTTIITTTTSSTTTSTTTTTTDYQIIKS